MEAARGGRRGIMGAVGLIAALTIAARGVGFVRWLVHSWTLEGGSATAGAYATANQLPNILFEVAAGGALASVVIPLVATPLARADRREVDRVASALLGWALVVLVPLGAAVALLAPVIAAALPTSTGVTAVQAEDFEALVATLLRVFAVQIPLYGVGIVLSGVLQAHERFLWPALVPLLSSLVVIASYLWFGALADGNQADPGALSSAAVAVLGWGTTAGVVVMTLIQLLPVRRLGVRLRPRLDLPAGAGRRALRLAGAGIGALIAQQVSVLVVVVLAPLGGDAGTLSIYQYAQALYVLPYAILAVPVATAVFPRLAEVTARRSEGEFARLALASTRVIVVVGALGVALLVSCAPAAPALFGVDESIAGAVAWMAPGVVGYALIFHVSRLLYAVDRGRDAVLGAASGWIVVTVASVLLVRAWAPAGGDGASTLRALGAANSIGMAVAGAALLVAACRLLDRGAGPALARCVTVALAGAALAGVLGHLTITTVMASAGTGMVGAALGAIPAALVAAIVQTGVVYVLDRASLGPILARMGVRS